MDCIDIPNFRTHNALDGSYENRYTVLISMGALSFRTHSALDVSEYGAYCLDWYGPSKSTTCDILEVLGAQSIATIVLCKLWRFPNN